MTQHWQGALSCPRAYGDDLERALLKGSNDAFVVTELLDRPLSGEGEHLYLWVKSDGDNTQWLAKSIADALGVAPVDVSFSGLKDRNAITYQWFSVYDPKRQYDNAVKDVFESFPTSELLSQTRDTQKLRRGMHLGNRFAIQIIFDRSMTGEAEQRLAGKLQRIRDFGVPNYFGLQRFGHEGNNLKAFDDYTQLLQAKSRKRVRKPKGIVISAARSHLFNKILAVKVKLQIWQDLHACEPLVAGMPSSPLWGRGRLASEGELLALEQATANELSSWTGPLECLGLQQERRSNVCRPAAFTWQFDGQCLGLSFELPPGEYATTVLREIADCYEPPRALKEPG